MGDFVKARKKLPEWTDSLFTNVYQWVKQGTTPDKNKAESDILHYPANHPLNALALCMRALVLGGEITPDWLIQQHYSSAKNPEDAEENRKALVLKYISKEELLKVLSDVDRINWLWPAPVKKATAENKAKAKPKLEKPKRSRSRLKNNQDQPQPLADLADNEKAALLAERYEGVAVHPESEAFYIYKGGIWEGISALELGREMGRIYSENRTNFTKTRINNVVDALKIIAPVIGEPCKNAIAFSNGVLDIETRLFTPHKPDNWLFNHNGIEYTPAQPEENLSGHAPNFHHWLDHAANQDPHKMKRIFAALYMVLANRYDWQLFLEITGEGGSGKSVFTQIATLLAGAHNTASGNMAALDTARGRAQFVNKSMITLPDQPKYTGEGTGIKAITGGDAVEIDPKHEHQYTTVIRAVVIATNNTPMIFTERAGGVARRRVIFQFNNKVKEEDKDPLLAEKIADEIPVIVRRLLATFSNPEEAKRLLIEQRDSEEAREIKRKSDPLVDFCGYLMGLLECDGMIVGNAEITPLSPRRYLYHAYLTYIAAHGLGRPISLTRFGLDMPGAMAEYGKEYKRKQCTKGADKGRVITNILLNDDAEGWLPSATGNSNQKE